MGSSHSYLVNLEAGTVQAIPKVTAPAFTNPNHISQLSPVLGFHTEPQVNHLDQLTGYLQIPNRGMNPAATVLYQQHIDCVGTTTSISSDAPVPNAVSGPRPVYNQCGELVGYIGSVVKNAAAPASIMML